MCNNNNNRLAISSAYERISVASTCLIQEVGDGGWGVGRGGGRKGSRGGGRKKESECTPVESRS